MSTPTSANMKSFDGHYYEYSNYVLEPHVMTSDELSSVTIVTLPRNNTRTLMLHYKVWSHLNGHLWDYTAWLDLKDVANNFKVTTQSGLWMDILEEDNTVNLHYSLSNHQIFGTKSPLLEVVDKYYVIKRICNLTYQLQQKKMDTIANML